MRAVTIQFVGYASDAVAKEFYHLIVDGGLEEQIVNTLEDNMRHTPTPVQVELKDINNDTLDMAFLSKKFEKVEKKS